MQIVTDAIIYSAVLAPVALAFFLRLRTYRFFDLSISIPFAAGGYAAYLFGDLGWPIAILLAASVALSIALIMFKLIFSWLLKSNVSPLTLLLASLAVATAFQHLLAVIFGSSPIFILGRFSGTLFASSETRSWQLLFAGAVLVLTGAASLWYDGAAGVRFRAVAENRDLAPLFGIAVNRIFIGVTAVSGVLSGIGGIAFALFFQIRPGAGLANVMIGATAALVVSTRAVYSVVVAITIGSLFELVGAYISADWQSSVVYALLLATIVWRSSSRRINWRTI